MRYAFAGEGQALLETFARSKVLLAFDYDGTLAPLVSAPAQAAIRRSTRLLLSRVSRRYPVVVISGRARDDALERLGGIEVCRVVGNHGAEPAADGAAIRRRVRRWLPVLKTRLGRYHGVEIEDKVLSIAVHYRTTPDRDAARQAILSAAAELAGVRIVGGKLVVNFVVPEAPHKGLALERERTHFACDKAIYAGDDVTDEDVFQLDRPWLLSICVGRKPSTAARYYLRDQAEIDRLLETLVALRAR